MMMWVKGNKTSAAKLDPTIGALVAAVVEILIRFDLHTRMGISAEDMMATLLDIAFVALTIRAIQINIRKNPPADPPAEPAPPANDPTAPDTAA
jgi:hypothetical protein